MIDDKKMDELLAASPAARVTQEYMESRIASKEFIRVGKKGTVCSITMDNGYEVYGESACVNPENYNQEIGERIAYDNAFRQLWPLFGFLLAEKQHLAAQS